jgi:hypothetical protein
MITPKEIKALAKAMHQTGIVSLKTPEVEILVQPQAPKTRRKKQDTSLIETGDGTYKGYTEEQLLAWSASPIAG